MLRLYRLCVVGTIFQRRGMIITTVRRICLSGMKGLDDDAPRMFKPQSLKEERHSADVLEISNLDLLMFLASRAKSIAIASTTD